MFRSVPLRFATLGLLLSSGCATTSSTSNAALEDLKVRLADAQRKEVDARHRIDDLENRVFLLTDQIESQKVAAQTTHSPRLPVVTLRPTAPEEQHGVGAQNDERPDEPEFLGEAQSGDATHVRTVLSGTGMSDGTATTINSTPTPAETPKHRAHATKSQPSDVQLVSVSGSGDNLGVAPVPPIAKSHPITVDKASTAKAERAPLDEEPLSAYRNAYADVTAGHYDEAEAKLRAFVKHFPHHDYADNAQYWLGECFYARQRYREAAAEFRTAVAKYPTGNKAPDALLKLAYSLIASDQAQEGKRLLEELPSTYPRSEAARLAGQKLQELGKTASNRPEAVR